MRSLSENEELLVKFLSKRRKCALQEGLSARSRKGIVQNKLKVRVFKSNTKQSKLAYYSAVPGVRNRLWIEEMVSASSEPLGSNLPLL